MKPYVTIELGTFATEPKALDLLSYPEGIFGDPDPGCRAEVWASGKRHTFRRRQGEDAVACLTESRFNEASLAYDRQVWPDRQVEVKLSKRIVLSPRHSLWLPPFSNLSEKGASRSGSQARASHQSLHNFVAWNDIRNYPTVTQVELRIEKNWSDWEEDEVFASLVNLVWQGVTDRIVDLCAFGAVSFDSSGRTIIDSLAAWPRAIPFLDRRFGRLCPVLLGEESPCLRLRDALASRYGQRLELRQRGSLAMLVLGQEIVDRFGNDDEVKNFLVPKEGRPGQIRPPDATLGEYALGEEHRIHLYIEKTRFTQLYGPEALAFQEEGVIYWETVDSLLCNEAGIMPGAVLIAYSDADVVSEARRRIRHRYGRLGTELSPAQRVWKAHEDVLREIGERLFGPEKDEAISLIHRHFKGS